MSISKLTWIIAFAVLVATASACSSTPAQAPLPTRVATQTPWIIYMPVTSTPEPATVTPLPTVTPSQPTRLPTRIPPTRAPATKPPPTKAPVAVAPTVTPAPTCNYGTAEPYFPENNVTRILNAVGTQGPAFEFKWYPPAALGMNTADPTVGYRIDITSRRLGTGQVVGGDVVYVSQNKYIQDKEYVYPGNKVRTLGAGDNAAVTWQVTVVKTTGGFDDQGGKIGSEVSCGAPSTPFIIQLTFQ